MAKFVAKPVIKEAVQFTQHSLPECQKFCGEALRYHSDSGCEIYHMSYGWVSLNLGDYIVKIESGLYRTPADVFEANHEPYIE